MDNFDIPKGKRYTHVYVERGETYDDSRKMRVRISSYVAEDIESDTAISRQIRKEIGEEVFPRLLRKFLQECSINIFLDSITVVHHTIPNHDGSYPRSRDFYRNQAKKFILFVQRVFEEENMSYVVDEQGGIHRYIDEEFSRNRVATLVALSHVRYLSVNNELENAFNFLRKSPPDAKMAIRSVFYSLESLFKRVYPLGTRYSRWDTTHQRVRCHTLSYTNELMKRPL